jgi:3-dehydroquinate dehydratase/shikimate dehydrogenase
MRICLSLYGSTEEICREMASATEADLFEIRPDLSAPLNYERIRSSTSKPLVFASHGNPELLKRACRIADYLDVGPHPAEGPDYIVSVHAGDEDPLKLWTQHAGDHITKIVLDTQDYAKITGLLELNRTHYPDALCFAMGEVGAFSRVLSSLRGAPWIYASPAGRPTAPGQFTPEELVATYRIRRFEKEPEAVFGIIGNPVSHSRSPEYHNRKFAEAGLPWIYLPFHCTDLASLLEHAPRFGIRGFSVTHPYKEAVLPFLAQQSENVRSLRSCNTLYYTGNGWHGINTDAKGVTELLRLNDVSIAGARVLILGAGSSARTIASVVRPHAKDLLFLNRTPEHAQSLAAEFSGRAGTLQDFGREPYDVLFNATPIGWIAGECPINTDLLQKETVVIDAVYRQTTLLQKATALGCRAITGEAWFEAQAEAQFQFWKEQEPPLAKAL